MRKNKEKAANRQQERDAEFALILQEVIRQEKENPWNFEADYRQNPENYLLILLKGSDPEDYLEYVVYEKASQCMILSEDSAEGIEIAKEMLQLGVRVVTTFPELIPD